jgi:hypothetical protein
MPTNEPELRTHSRAWRLAGLIGLLLVLVLLLSQLPLKPFGDDYLIFQDDPRPGFFSFLSQHHPYSPTYYRPLLLVFTNNVQYLWGTASWPVHIAHLLLHLGLGLLVYRAALRLELGVRVAVIAGLWTLGSQLVAHPVLSLDTFPQLAFTLAGWGSVYLLYLALWKAPCGRRRLLTAALSALVLFAALLCRENALGFVPAHLVLIAVYYLKHPDERRRTAWFATAPLIVTGAYFLLRSGVIEHTVLSVQFALGSNLLLNPAKIVAGAVSPVSTAAVYCDFARGQWLTPLIAAALSAALVTLIAIGLRRSPRRGTAAVLALLLFAVVSPLLFLRHISELYAYAALPAIALIGAFGLDSLASTLKRKRGYILCAFLVLLLGVNLAGVVSKAGLLRSNGEDAERLLDQLETYHRRMEPDEVLLLVDEPPSRPAYSIYHVHGFRLIDYGIALLPILPRRYDYISPIVPEEKLELWDPGPGLTLLTVDPETLEVLPYSE